MNDQTKLIEEALAFEEKLIMKKVISQWKSSQLQATKQKELMAIAEEHHLITTCSKCVQSWKVYAIKRREKHEMESIAVNFNERMVLVHCMKGWQRALDMAESVRAHQEALEDLGLKIKMRQVFENWKFYVILQKESRDMYAAAEEFRRMKYLTLGLNGLKENVLICRKSEYMTAQAIVFHEQSLLRNVLRVWIEQLEYDQEKKLALKTARAHCHYNTKLLRKAFVMLGQYAEWRHVRKEQYAMSKEHYDSRLKPVMMDIWIEHTKARQMERVMIEQANEFRREKLMQRMIQTWRVNTNEQQDARMLDRMAVLYEANAMIRRGFQMWRTRLRIFRHQLTIDNMAREHYATTLLMKALRNWMNYLDGVKAEVAILREAAEYHDRRLLFEHLTELLKVCNDPLSIINDL